MFLPSEIWAFIQQSYAAADAGLPNPPRRVVLPKRYTATFATVAPGGSQTQPIQISANGDFVLCRMAFIATNAGAAQTASTAIVPQWRIQITDSGTDEQYGNQPIDLNVMATNAVLSGEKTDEVYPRLISGSSTLNLAVTSYEAANTYSVDFVLIGVLVKTFGL
jgi:hypothetical protein